MIVQITSKNMESSWMFGAVLIAHFLSFWDGGHQTSFSFVAARPFTSFQLATGEWGVSIRGGYRMDPSLIFLSVDDFHAPSTSTPNSKNKVKSIPVVKRRRWGRFSLDCTLSLASDGTFVLTPKQVTTVVEDGNSTSLEKKTIHTPATRRKMFTRSKKQTETLESSLLDLRGSWNVLANPYCVTDRFYDQVSLTAYPRQKVTAIRGEETDDAAEERVLQTVQLTMNCRVWGRHTYRGTKPYRMSHGTLVCRDIGTDQNAPWWKGLYRPVVASFSAERSSDKPNHEGWVDKERYGY